MKVLIDPLSNLIHGVYEEPLNFDISGHYVIDIPPQILSAVPSTDNSVSDLLTAKGTAWLAYFVLAGTNLVSDELISSPNVDATNSNGVEIGPNKRTVIYPGGTLLTNSITGPNATKATCLHFSGFSLYRSAVDPANQTSPTQGPSKMLYSYNPTLAAFETFNPADFTVSICQATGPFTNIQSWPPAIPDSATPINVTYPATFRMKFVNNTTLPYRLSDWYLVHA